MKKKIIKTSAIRAGKTANAANKPSKRLTIDEALKAGSEQRKHELSKEPTNALTYYVPSQLAALPKPAHPVVQTIKNDDQYRAAALAFTERKAWLKAREAERKAVTDPINKGLKAFKALADAAMEPIEEEVRQLNGAMTAYDLQKEQMAREVAERQAAILAKKGDHDAAALVQIKAAEAVHVPPVEGMTYVDTWVAKVTDMVAVPAYFEGVEVRSVMQGALNTLARLYKDSGKTVPGVVFECVRSARPTGR